MTKKITVFLALVLTLALVTGCAGTPVIYYTNCTCPVGGHNQEPTPPPAEGALKTGLYIGTSVSDSKSAAADKAGEAAYDVTIVAVTVDDKGIIRDCIIDSIKASVAFDATGAVTSDLTAEVLTKNELGEAYGMKAYGGSKYEWNEQAAALAKYAKDKTVAQLKDGAVNESGKAKDADLASVATIYIGGYVDAIEAAVANAKHLGAQSGDTLKLAVISGIGSSVSATAEKAGTAQLDSDVVALTEQDGIITSCYIDALQAKVNFDATGTITTDLTAAPQTKNELGEGYGMKAWGNAKFEWNEQAANFAKYAKGKTADQIANIAVTEGKPSDADLSATVTIAIGGFQALIAKAMK